MPGLKIRGGPDVLYLFKREYYERQKIKPISEYAYNRSTPLPDSAELRAMSIDAFRTLLREEAKRMYPDSSRLMEFLMMRKYMK